MGEAHKDRMSGDGKIMSKKCWICGGEAVKGFAVGEEREKFAKPDDDKNQRFYCDKCFSKIHEERKADKEEYVRLKKKLMFERAVRILEKQNVDMYEYQEAVNAVEEYVAENPSKFDSADEMIAAIILIQNEVYCKIQYKILEYTVDFCLPDLKVILEIDGDRHGNRREYDNLRDSAIKRHLGTDWEIVRIKTEFLEMKAEKLYEAIFAVLDDREKRRTINKIWKEN